MSDPSLAERMAAAARELASPEDPQETMETAIRLAVSEVRGSDAAAISIARGRKRIDTPAATDDLARDGDQLQYRLQEGPCLDAVRDERVVHSANLAADPRWPVWGPRVVETTGARSMLCFRLFTDAETVGALNLYSRTVGGFDAADRDEGLALASHISVAVRAAQQISGMSAGMDTRTLIGQAQGIAMERFDIDSAQAFSLLRRLSSHANVKLRDIALEIVDTRKLPDSS